MNAIKPAFVSFCSRAIAAFVFGFITMTVPPHALAADPVRAPSQATPAHGSCSDAMRSSTEWSSLRGYLELNGLALIANCTAGGHAQNIAMVVEDSHKASRVLRGPLADGEAVETGDGLAAVALADKEAQGWSPDVRFNRAWLTSAMARHHLIRTAGGAWRAPKNDALVQIAAR